MRKIYLSFLIFCLISSITVLSQQTLKVNLSTTIRPVTHCASGSLYGITEALPSDVANLMAPLKPFIFTQPALSGSGHQQGVEAAAVPVSAKIASTTGKGTTTISTTTYTAANGIITVLVNVTNKFYAYRIHLTPATITGFEKNENNEIHSSPNPFDQEGSKISFKGKFHYQITDLNATVGKKAMVRILT
ncbi:MAG: hypothetical protein H7329_17560 [Opitutaceae bacterium]|nr:hypothetical protein [Cytophagales bacterium]